MLGVRDVDCRGAYEDCVGCSGANDCVAPNAPFVVGGLGMEGVSKADELNVEAGTGLAFNRFAEAVGRDSKPTLGLVVAGCIGDEAVIAEPNISDQLSAWKCAEGN